MTPAPLNLAVLPEAQNLNGSGFFLSISVMNKKSEHTSPLHSYQATDIRPPSQLINNHINPLKQSLTMLLHTLYLESISSMAGHAYTWVVEEEVLYYYFQ